MDAGSNIEFPDSRTVVVKSSQSNESGAGKLTFLFDRTFKMDSVQEEIYNVAAKPVVESVLDGFNGTVFAYGQTSSGKTHTMQGPNIDDPENRGIIPRMVDTVFDVICESPDHIEFTVKVSIVEIYLERIRDLLCPEKVNLKIRQDKQKGVYIEDVTESYVTEEKDIYNLMKLGNSNRAISATNMNEGSSRSHLIFMLTIHQTNSIEMSAKTGRLYLVDLAGSEKVGKTGAQGQTLQEAKKINQSLSSLGNVINALTDEKKKSHIPYRDSKLTRLLQESLGGNSKTTLIITCSPSVYNEQETISTLRFGQRAKAIKNTPKINREFTVAELQLLLEKAERTIEELTKRINHLEGFIRGEGLTPPNIDSPVKPSDSMLEKSSLTDLTSEYMPTHTEDATKTSISSDEEEASEEDEDEAEEEKEEKEKSVTKEKPVEEEEKKVEGETNLEVLDVSEPEKQEMQSTEEKELEPKPQAEQGVEQQVEISAEKSEENLIAEYAPPAEIQDKIATLEKNLEAEKSEFKAHLIKIEDLKKELLALQNKFITTEKENEVLIQKLAVVSMKFAEAEKKISRKEDEIEKLATANEALTIEVAELKKSKEQLMTILDEKNEEIDIMRRQTIQKEVHKTDTLREEALAGKNQAINQLMADNSPYQDLIFSLQKSLNLKDDKTVRQAVNQFFSNRHLAISSSDMLSEAAVKLEEREASNSKEVAILREENTRLKKELESSKVLLDKLEKEKEKLSKEYEDIAQSAVPDYEELRKRAVEEAVKKERAKAEREQQLILNDLQNRVDKVVMLEMMLEEEQSRSSVLESHLKIGEKGMRKQILALEENIKQLNIICHQLASQRSTLAVDYNLLQTKMQRKNDRINLLEQQLQEAREQLESNKRKIDSLKAFATHQPLSKGFDQYIQIDHFETKDFDTLDESPLKIQTEGLEEDDMMKRSMPNTMKNSRIVKHIKGGSRGGSRISFEPKSAAFKFPNN